MGRTEANLPAAGADQAAAFEASFASAHRALAADKALQFEMKGIEPPPPPPGWLQPLLEFLQAMGPLFKIVFWLGLAAIVLAILWFIGRELIRIRLPERTDKLDIRDDAWRPAPAAALALLSDADALAAEGRFDEAVHLLLLRSINDIDGRLPNTVRPALTARDIAGLGRLPSGARPAFDRITRVVESSLFGGRPVDSATWADCRQAYEAFAFPQAWAA
ncbi:DUF4129 domain-containing protein [Brevundimonas sp. UBA7664]|uniref:DUF4129 domain-containing protein n=1 Tax=Brevundimonas sp. UBA7664 TaxID=1946141 RepID=UPI0025BB46C7|nr:DUF4129 domain-containing protein [Brevundimonas sp. UBA7664]